MWIAISIISIAVTVLWIVVVYNLLAIKKLAYTLKLMPQLLNNRANQVVERRDAPPKYNP